LLWGPLTRFALGVALVAAAADQAAKLWLLFVFDLGARGIVTLTPFLDLVLTWNTGIRLRPVPSGGAAGAMGAAGAQSDCGHFAVDLAGPYVLQAHRAQPWPHHWRSRRQRHRSPRLRAVADFVLFHLTTASFSFKWYVFNLADVAIVAGVIGLLYETLVGADAAKAP
jgi:Lipoprotein signal peptidase